MRSFRETGVPVLIVSAPVGGITRKVGVIGKVAKK